MEWGCAPAAFSARNGCAPVFVSRENCLQTKTKTGLGGTRTLPNRQHLLQRLSNSSFSFTIPDPFLKNRLSSDLTYSYLCMSFHLLLTVVLIAVGCFFDDSPSRILYLTVLNSRSPVRQAAYLWLSSLPLPPSQTWESSRLVMYSIRWLVILSTLATNMDLPCP